jgi:hypothetical protein
MSISSSQSKEEASGSYPPQKATLSDTLFNQVRDAVRVKHYRTYLKIAVQIMAVAGSLTAEHKI